jgi:hypothetical protein
MYELAIFHKFHGHLFFQVRHIMGQFDTIFEATPIGRNGSNCITNCFNCAWKRFAIKERFFVSV